MDLMWISFYSLGAMALAAVLIYVARYKISSRIISIIVSMVAWALLIIDIMLERVDKHRKFEPQTQVSTNGRQ